MKLQDANVKESKQSHAVVVLLLFCTLDVRNGQMTHGKREAEISSSYIQDLQCFTHVLYSEVRHSFIPQCDDRYYFCRISDRQSYEKKRFGKLTGCLELLILLIV